eukprot:Filipodium_phascolosomae@DN2316_c0_g1_i4.p1
MRKNVLRFTDVSSPMKHNTVKTATSSPQTSSNGLRGVNENMLNTPQRHSKLAFDDEAEGVGLFHSPVKVRTKKASTMLISPNRVAHRKISKVPFRVLDAPQLVDDFYLNLLDWSSTNNVAVALGSCVYVWNGSTGSVTKLLDLPEEESCTAVRWEQSGNWLSIGSNNGETQVWDVNECKRVRTMFGHKCRVGALSWSGSVLSSGSRDHLIYHRDTREQDHFSAKLVGHKQEVCGLEWGHDGAMVASGGNDNKLLIWDRRCTMPMLKFTDHTAAVKAISWSPHQAGVLASGGGTADRHIRLWNCTNNTSIGATDTGSQVCNMHWSKNVNEIVSSHGYSLNQIVVWKFPSMFKVAVLPGHSSRVLYMSASPDGQTIVTGAGDETLRFWNIFPAGAQTGPPRMIGSLGKGACIR